MTINQNQSAIYKTYLNYSISLNRLIKQEYPTIKDLFKKIFSLNGYNKLKKSTACNFGELEKSLHLTWHTEMLLIKEIKHPELLNYALPWSMTQSYYCIYQITRAYFNAFGRKIPQSHSKTWTTIKSDLVSNKDRFPPPWCCLMEGDTLLERSIISNIDNPLEITLDSSLYSPYTSDPWQYFGRILKTTHTAKIKNTIDNWKKENKKTRISKEERLSLINKLKPTTLFDFLYRLRIRSNYQDIDLFLLPYIDQINLIKWQGAITQTVSYTLGLFECMIIKATGKSKYEEILKSSLPGSTTIGVPVNNLANERWEDIKNYI